MTKIIHLTNSVTLVSSIEETGSEIGEPDCKLLNPFVINYNAGIITIQPWLSDFTNQNTFMIHSDKILTISEPSKVILEKYNGVLTNASS